MCSQCHFSLMLLNHFLELRAEDTSVVAIKRDMEPISFLALDNEFTGSVRSVGPWRVLPSLRNYVDHQVPGSRLTRLRQGACDRLLCFVGGCEIRHRFGSRCSGQPGNIGPGQRGTTPRGGARRLLNNGLPCGEGVVFGKLTRLAYFRSRDRLRAPLG